MCVWSYEGGTSRRFGFCGMEGWLDLFEDETLPDLAKRLSRVYGVEIKVAERLRNYSFSGKISYERGVDYITRLMEETNGVVCEVENGVLWLR